MESKQGQELKRFTQLLETIRRDREPEKGKTISGPVKAGYSVSDKAKDNLQG